MKKLFFVIAILVFLHVIPAQAGGVPNTAAQAIQNADTIDEQLSLLRDVSIEYAAELETGGWDVSLTCDAAQTLPEDLLPQDHMEDAELSVQDFEDTRFIAIYCDQGEYRLLGDYQVRIPEHMRASSLAEADAVLCLVHTTQARDDYIGSAYNRHYYAYVYRRGSNTRTTAYHTFTTPPMSGKGTLRGEALSLAEIWSGVRQWFYGIIEVSYPNGTASYRITGQTCCLTELKGDFTRYEIPAEVDGHPVTGIEECKNDTLQELTLPEGIVWIRYVGGKELRKMNFPSTLRRIEKYISTGLSEMILNEGLEETGDFTLLRGCGESFSLPSTLKQMGDGTLEYGAECTYLIIPEGVTKLPKYFLSSKGEVLCVYVPDSVVSIGDSVFDYGNILIYTPEGSVAARYAESHDFPWVPCARAEDMPKPVIEKSEEGFEYAILEGEAILTGYTGNEACLRVPDTLGGFPVAVIREHAFERIDTLRAILFPDTVRKMEGSAVYHCDSLEAAFIPASVTHFHSQAVLLCGDAVEYMPKESVPWITMRSLDDPHAVWTPGTECTWFPELADQYDPDTSNSGTETEEGFPKAGDIVTFGHYEQDGDPANGPEPIEWIVLDTEDGYTTLLSRYGLETKPYCETGSAQWKTCSLRKWLNDSFLNEAFTDEEQKKIETSAVSEKGVTAVSDGMGSTSLDKVYLLSMDEADRYFDSNEERKCVPTQAAVNHGADVRDETCGWWLRTHTNSKRADGTGFGGKLYKSMVEGYADDKVVRPVIRLLTDNIPDEI